MQRRRERGRIELGRVNVVETAQLAGDGEPPHPQGFPFQLGYIEGAHSSFTLYLLAAREQERADWIRALRQGMSDRIYIFLFTFFTTAGLKKKTQVFALKHFFT